MHVWNLSLCWYYTSCLHLDVSLWFTAGAMWHTADTMSRPRHTSALTDVTHPCPSLPLSSRGQQMTFQGPGRSLGPTPYSLFPSSMPNEEEKWWKGKGEGVNNLVTWLNNRHLIGSLVSETDFCDEWEKDERESQKREAVLQKKKKKWRDVTEVRLSWPVKTEGRQGQVILTLCLPGFVSLPPWWR